MSNSIGMIETRGYVAAITAADAMVKSATVSLLGQQEVGDGLVAIIARDDVGAIKAARHTMTLEDQRLDEEDERAQVTALTRKLAEQSASALWEDE